MSDQSNNALKELLDEQVSVRAKLTQHETAIKELRSHGTAAMLDCREMRVRENNASYCRKRLRAIKDILDVI